MLGRAIGIYYTDKKRQQTIWHGLYFAAYNPYSSGILLYFELYIYRPDTY